MDGQLLTLNAGSSSIKYALFERDGSRRLLDGQIDGIGVDPGAGPSSHAQALDEVLERLRAHGSRIAAIGHRIVHGGMTFVQPVRIEGDVLARIDALRELAPLHQPHNVAGVRAALDAFPGVPQVACFDTAFHAVQPALNRRFALPQSLHDAGVRRYGFHGLSYESIVAQLRAAAPDVVRGRVVVAHLGNGSSMCAMRDGRSVATTMTFSPLDGLPMGTRCGRIDAAVVLHLLAQGRGADDIARLLFRESGLRGLSGVSSDMRTLEASPEPGARLAIDYFVEHAVRELAGMAAALRGVDALVFTGGIGENATSLRERIVREASWMAPDDVRVLRTDEEGVIARHTAASLEAA